MTIVYGNMPSSLTTVKVATLDTSKLHLLDRTLSADGTRLTAKYVYMEAGASTYNTYVYVILQRNAKANNFYHEIRVETDEVQLEDAVEVGRNPVSGAIRWTTPGMTVKSPEELILFLGTVYAMTFREELMVDDVPGIELIAEHDFFVATSYGVD